MSIQRKINIQQEILSTEWYGQGLNAVPLIFEAATTSVFSLHKTLGFSYHKFYCTYKGKYCDGNYWKPDFERLSRILIEKLQNPTYLSWLLAQYFKEWKEAAKVHKEIDELNLSSLSDKELLSLTKRANDVIRESLGVAHIIEPFSVNAENIIKDMLAKELKGQSSFQSVFSLLISPIKKPFMVDYDQKLSALQQEKNQEKKKALLDSIQKEFYWMKNGYAQRSPLTEKIILEESKEAHGVNPDPGNTGGKNDYSRIKQEKAKIIKQLHLSPKLQQLIKVTEEFAYLQDERKKNSLIAIDYFCRVADELVTRTPLTKEEFYFLLPQELDEKHLTSVMKKELQQRMKQMTLLNIKGTVYLTTEPIIMEKEKDHLVVINGTPASLGTATGKVKVCKNLSQISKVEPGDILVVPMTRPEYVPAMKRAAAIITDEGGLTCHAAVIARELGKPCIIGTRIATKVLKDNDWVIVKAHHGTVRKIE